MLQLPMPTPEAIPWALMVATVGSLEFHVTAPEMSPAELSKKVPVAVRAVVVPLATDIDDGEIAIVFS